MPCLTVFAFLVGDLGDVAQAQAVFSERELPDVFHIVIGADHAQLVDLSGIGQLSKRLVEVVRIDETANIADADIVRVEGREVEVDPHLARRDALELHLGDAGNPLQRAHDPALDNIVGVFRGVLEAEAPLEDGILGILVIPVVHDGYFLDVLGQVPADAVEFLPDLDLGEMGVGAPFELEANDRAPVLRA